MAIWIDVEMILDFPVGEKFDVSSGACYWRRAEFQPFKAEFFGAEFTNLLDDFFVYCRIADHAAFTDLIFTCFKLGFDERYNMTAGLNQIFQRRENAGQGNKGSVNAAEVGHIRNILRSKVARIGVFHNDHPRIFAEFIVKLVGSAVDGVNFSGAMLEHKVGESSGGGSDIQTDAILQIKVELLVCAFNFKTAPADILLFLFDENFHIVLVLMSRFFGQLFANTNNA